jgi:hypothetical protein
MVLVGQTNCVLGEAREKRSRAEEQHSPAPRDPAPWTEAAPRMEAAPGRLTVGQAGTDGSFRKSVGSSPATTKGQAPRSTLKDKQVALDAIVRGSLQVVPRQRITTSGCSLGFYERHIAKAGHSGAGPGQRSARAIRAILHTLEQEGRTAEIQWVKGHAGIPGNERADLLTGKAAEKTAVWSPRGFG